MSTDNNVIITNTESSATESVWKRKWWSVNSLTMIVLLSLYFCGPLNIAFWRYIWDNLPFEGFSSIFFAISLPVMTLIFFLLFFSLTVTPYVTKIILIPLILCSASAMYFMFNLSVYINPEMVKTVFETTSHESGEILGGIFFLWMILFGVIPAIALFKTRVIYRSRKSEVWMRSAIIAGGIVLIPLFIAVNYKSFAIVGRNNKQAVHLINPLNYISATIRHVAREFQSPREIILLNDQSTHNPFDDDHFTVFIIVIGEAARAKNFSLNGYERDTNPKLSKENIVYFRDVLAGGTLTAVVIPKLFSPFRFADVHHRVAYRTENLLDILQRTGYRVIWRENKNNAHRVNRRVEIEDMSKKGFDQHRIDDMFYDEVLLEGLDEMLSTIDRDTVIVLHMIGSHGPAYHKRYHKEFERFTPASNTINIQNRPREEIVNTYDNTILYTDHVLASAINILKKYPDLEAGLLYVSDHGESLGENGIYLHGLPYSIAPEEQKRVPMILWMSETMQREDHVDYERLQADSGKMQLTHDHFFHSIIGLLEIESSLYDPQLDLFREYRTEEMPVQNSDKSTPEE